MNAIQPLRAVPLARGPEILCGELAAFNESDLTAVQQAFRGVKPCQLFQAWRPKVSPGFAPASVQVGWREDCLFMLAELTDEDIYSYATGINQRMWELGDAFEIFLRPADHADYIQLDITPNNHWVQLRIPSAEALRRAQTANEFAGLVMPGTWFRTGTWLFPEQEKWFVFAAIPARAVSGRDQLAAKERWHFSFSRYDYTRGQLEPVISSTSPHAEANFHRQQEWGVIQFERGQTLSPKAGGAAEGRR
ncbi:MAG TPA: hypothetical protein VL863_11760 [bacterium]|jgi:hypothetical protein|nr:hypothetical protein [bacterium]